MTLNCTALDSPSLLSKRRSLRVMLIILIVIISANVSQSRKHHLVLKNDIRKYVTVSTFGYLFGGQLRVKVESFSFLPFDTKSTFGFTLAKTMSDSLTPYLEGHQDRCLLLDDVRLQNEDNIGLISLAFDLNNNLVLLNCNEKLSKLRLYDTIDNIRGKRDVQLNQTETKVKTLNSIDTPLANNTNVDQLNKAKDSEKGMKLISTDKPKPKVMESNSLAQIDANNIPLDSDMNDRFNENEDIDEDSVVDNKELKKEDKKQTSENEFSAKGSCNLNSLKLIKTLSAAGNPEYSFQIQAFIADESQEGLYTLFFHNCPNYNSRGEFRHLSAINLSMLIIENNLDNYLSAGEIPLPQLYFALSVIFFIIGFIWVNVIRSKREDAFKIHYLMGLLVFVKAFSLLFHGINYHFIAKEGSQVETWAVLYYITHLLKGALLIITIVLIGTGWAFIKHILSDKDKKIFMIVIPLQVLANIADIITEESEEGELIHSMWREIFILVDLLCCGAILFPVVWSIRHLQEASQTDGKAAINLRKLKLFRHFYVMIVCYIYFTRIIVYLLKITVPFQYEWLNIFFQHAAILLFFILTGYHFQPTPSNPYFQLDQDEDDLEMEEVLFVQPNSFGETKKRNRDVEANSDNLISKRESSHDFD